MAFDLLDFTWRASRSGYEVVQGRHSFSLTSESDGQEQFLTRRFPQNASNKYNLVKPLETEDGKPLFWKFGSLSSPEDIVDFANEFGFLGGEFKESIWVTRATPEGNSDSHVIGERISAWRAEIQTIGAVTELWQHVKVRGEESTRKCLLRQCQQAARKDEINFGQLYLVVLKRILESEAHSRHRFGLDDVCGNLKKKLCQGGDAISIAMDCIVSTINLTLEEGVDARLTWTRETERSPRARLYLAPSSLHKAIWMQFTEAVRGRKAYEECSHCLSLFEVPITKVGRPFAYCSEACRMKAYRKRQAEARRLWKEGMPVQEIARRLQVKEESIEAWTTGKATG